MSVERLRGGGGDRSHPGAAKIREKIKYSRLSRVATLPIRIGSVTYSARQLARAIVYLVRGREWTNLSYDLAPDNVSGFSAAIGLAAGVSPALVRGYASELRADEEFAQRYHQRVTGTRLRYVLEPRLRLSKCLIYYMLVRANQPQFVVEAGTAYGLGSLAICRALARNAAEGAPGKLVTIDIASDRGDFLDGDEGGLVTQLTGDSVATIATLDSNIDLFIHDTYPGHMREQFAALEPKLTKDAVVVTVWFVEEFILFCERLGWPYLEIAERPLDHWYPGGRYGIASDRMA